MVWPTANIPTYGRGVWLECNGQSFSRTQFPQLYETLGTTRVPDYQGVFLRGYGTKNHSKRNDDYNGISNTSHRSGAIGEVQGDTGRRFVAYIGHPTGLGSGYDADEWGYRSSGTVAIENGAVITRDPWDMGNGNSSGVVYGVASTPIIYNQVSPTSTNSTHSTWGDALVKYRYTMSCSGGGGSGGDDDGGDGGDGGGGTSCTLQEEQIDPVIPFESQGEDIIIDTELKWPIGNEFRPVNVAVKFMIKAK